MGSESSGKQSVEHVSRTEPLRVAGATKAIIALFRLFGNRASR
jgi:hypothetical protein